MDATTKMNPQIKAEWMARLRSGEFEQGKRALQKNGKFCCLGVLSEIAADAGVAERCSFNSVNGDGDPVVSVRYNDYTGTLSSEIGRWSGLYGLEVPDEAGDPVNVETMLMHMNDHLGKTFPEIADWVEENL
jgi:hypothetical protein